MKILSINRDTLTNEMLGSKFEQLGHEFVAEPVKNDGIERAGKEQFDVILIDPSPMKDAQAIVMGIRRVISNYPYMVLVTSSEDEIDFDDVVKSGCNDFLRVPVGVEDLERKTENASRLLDFFANLSDASEDFPSAGGVISKSAFNQLCLSALERTGRYNEKAYVLSISVENYQEVKNLDGVYVSDYCVSKMAHHMVKMRRQSDIVGQTGVNEYSILLQRTESEREATQAAKRFVATFDELNDFLPPEGHSVDIGFNILHLPTGKMPFEYSLSKKLESPQG